MLQKEFKENLIKSLLELGITESDDVKFIITPVVEEGKRTNSTDDWMRLGPIADSNLSNQYFNLEEAIGILSAPDSRFPLWVKVELIEKKDSDYTVELRTSKRFRVPSVLQNKDTGHPPFKVTTEE